MFLDNISCTDTFGCTTVQKYRQETYLFIVYNETDGNLRIIRPFWIQPSFAVADEVALGVVIWVAAVPDCWHICDLTVKDKHRVRNKGYW